MCLRQSSRPPEPTDGTSPTAVPQYLPFSNRSKSETGTGQRWREKIASKEASLSVPAYLFCSARFQPHTATHCSTLQHTATYCNTLQHTATCLFCTLHVSHTLKHTTTHCITLHHIATHCNTLQHTATHCNTMQHACFYVLDVSHTLCAATHCSTVQHTTTHCDTLQHACLDDEVMVAAATHCNTLHHSATHSNTQQHTATCLPCRWDHYRSCRPHPALHLQCVVVCCSVLRCVAVCWGVLQCVAVCCSVLQCVEVCNSDLELIIAAVDLTQPPICSALPCVAGYWLYWLSSLNHPSCVFCACARVRECVRVCVCVCVCVCVINFIQYLATDF